MSNDFDAIIVGAGFSGLYALHKLRAAGLSCLVVEAGDDVGGTWYWNRYPGARCDVESIQYSYSFSNELDQEWDWPERYAAQPDILKYLQHVADRFDLRRDIRFGTRVESAKYNERTNRWALTTEGGDAIEARYCIMATGCLSRVNLPNIPGVTEFKGDVYHTGQWPHEKVDFTGQRVGIIGTGSSACQAIPLIAEEASQLTVFQRTPNHCIPAGNHPMDSDFQSRIKGNYPALRAKWRASVTGSNFPVGNQSVHEVTDAEREAAYEHRWNIGGAAFQTLFDDLLVNAEANATATDFITRKIRQIVKDPVVAERLVPKHHPFAAKRLCIVTDYYETYNRPNVRLVSLRETPIDRIDATGVIVAGEHITVDALIFATGFDAISGALSAIDIRGRAGVSLRDEWAAGPVSYLGLMVAGFPNMFIVTGPGSPSVLSVMTMTIEQHVEWIAECIDQLERDGAPVLETTHAAQDAWMDHVNTLASGTLFPTANTWYTAANIEGKPRAFSIYVGGFRAYGEELARVRREGYSGFIRTPSAALAEL